MSEIAKVFKGLPKTFNKGNVKAARTFYFSLGEKEKWTVSPRHGQVRGRRAGKPDEDADCFFKASEQMFLDVWNGTHTPVRQGLPDRQPSRATTRCC